MLQFSPLRAAMIVLVSLAGILFTLPNLVSKETINALPDWMPKQQIVLGLDLQGGSHLLLQVNREEIVTERVKELRREARSILANDNAIGHLIETNGTKLTIELTDASQFETAKNALQELDVPISTTLGGIGGVQEVRVDETADGKLTLELTDEGITERMSSVVSQSIEVVRNRIDELGTTEPTIQRQGTERILVQVPGFDDSQRLKDLISQTARLTFHMVHPTITAAQAKLQGLPVGTMILPSQDGGEELLMEDVSIGGESLVDSQPGFDPQTSAPIVTFRFDTRGAVVFAELTAQNIGQRFAVVLDNEVITAPVIQSAIPGGSGQITGNFTPESANDLAVLLRAGALPATLDIIEERSVGPSLGADSVAAGQLAGIVGALLVITFMFIAYGVFGLFANISLVINVLLILGALSVMGATLTLPGIAGIVLTIGMAVDANVLIFERIREEKRAGRSVVQAIESGFQRAFATIVDANVTTLIAAAILFFLGSGPIRGFAVTLAIGIITTVFTAYLLTQFSISRWFAWRRPKQLKVHLVSFYPQDTKLKFMNKRMIAFVFSAVTIIGSLGLFFTQGLNLGIDFKGGSAIEVRAIDGSADIADVRARVGELGLGDVQVQEFGSPQDLLIRIESQAADDDTAEQRAVNAVVASIEADYEVRRTEVVGPTVSGELALTGTIAVLAAIVCVLGYIWMRFEWQFAIGAIAALVHDVVLTIGMFAITGFEFNLASIAAILTIVGYSLNDTVVIYDRVRENLRKYRKMLLPDLLDMSVNDTMSRTVLTSVTTLLALAALVFFGGEVIRSFTFAMAWGVLVGTYSTIFIASPLLINFNLTAKAMEEPKPEEKRADGASI
jgi:SecD/SecF fusion protein